MKTNGSRAGRRFARGNRSPARDPRRIGDALWPSTTAGAEPAWFLRAADTLDEHRWTIGGDTNLKEIRLDDERTPVLDLS